jgi:bifunctional non-homologous end joining protein LigD
LHVVTPLARPKKGQKLNWDEAKQFARDVCSQMSSDSPDRYLINMSKAKRTGKIFLDYLRNDQFSTARAPLSTRARPHAPVSMPITWPQVKHGLETHSIQCPSFSRRQRHGPITARVSAHR